jgi:hypothetical protein
VDAHDLTPEHLDPALLSSSQSPPPLNHLINLASNLVLLKITCRPTQPAAGNKAPVKPTGSEIEGLWIRRWWGRWR